MENNLENILKNIPKLPGVYQFFDKNGKIIYIGKSVKLHSRVNSYFNGNGKLNFAKKKMVTQVCNIETVVTNTEIESLLLETNLIKKHKPKYNILMKDDKNHTYIKITNEIFPKVIKTRKKIKGGVYFGPYISTNYVNNIIKLSKKIFGHRSCNIVFDYEKIPSTLISLPKVEGEKNVKPIMPFLLGKSRGGQTYKIKIKTLNGAKVPCLDYYINRCSGPCLLEEDKMQNYENSIENIKNFLSGNLEDVIKEVSEKMKKYALELNFEKASELKQNLEAISSLKDTQIITGLVNSNCDVINYLEKYDSFYLSLIEIRENKITGIYNYEIKGEILEKEEKVIHFIENHYLNNKKNIDVILGENIDFNENILKELNIKIEIPKIGEKQELLTLAYKNAFEFAYKKHLESLSVKGFTKKDMEELLKILNYKKINKDILFECNDISHISGNHTVASRSIIENGKTNNSKYRKFKIKTIKEGEINDFGSMREIMTRRLAEIKKTRFVPDLIVIDGGKGQLSSVMEIINNEKNKVNSIKDLDEESKNFLDDLNSMQLVSLAKKEEELFLPGESKSIIIDKESNILRMIQKIRDEAHRFAITFNRDSRIKASKKSILEEIPGIGPKTRAKLLKEYGSIDNLVLDESLKKILSKTQIEALENHGLI
ncbi:MAG: excinuclease ABC subunit UvrC [Candidatus Gracilibacteria bacterium]|nr:excinuclease ABC subunit UvrC [Candidatus Gracilibacteria bacterium]